MLSALFEELGRGTLWWTSASSERWYSTVVLFMLCTVLYKEHVLVAAVSHYQVKLQHMIFCCSLSIEVQLAVIPGHAVFRAVLNRDVTQQYKPKSLLEQAVRWR